MIGGARVIEEGICHNGNTLVTYTLKATDGNVNVFKVPYSFPLTTMQQSGSVSVTNQLVKWYDYEVDDSLYMYGTLHRVCVNNPENITSRGRFYLSTIVR